MHKGSGLRRQALEGGKTLSRKARHRLESASLASSPLGSPGGSRPGSRAPSRNNSRPPSRVPSTAGSSDGEDATGSEDATELLTSELGNAHFDELIDKMEDRDFFKGNIKDRALAIAVYANSIAERYIDEDSHARLEDVLPILLRTIKEGTSAPGTRSALRAIAITTITCGDESGSFFSTLKDPLRLCVYDPASASGQAAAIRALGAVTFFGGADYQETISIMNILMGIVQSDGESVDALDNAEVAAAAIEEWCFLSTLLPTDVNAFSAALESFGDQLESSAAGVLSAAAQGIALMYEARYQVKTDEETVDVPVEAEEVEVKVARPYQQKNWVEAHELENENDYDIQSKLKELSRAPMRHVKKDVRKELHATFRDVAHAVEYPWRGPHYSTALRDDSGMFYGHRLHQNNMMIDRWWKLHRFASLRRVLQDGMGDHLAKNPTVRDALRNRLEAPSRFKQSHGDGDNLEGSDDSESEFNVPDQPEFAEEPSDESDEDDVEVAEGLQQKMSKLRAR